MTVTYTFDPGGANEKTLDESQLVSHNPVLRHTKKGDLRATFQEDRSLDDYAQRQDRLNIDLDGTTKWTGFIVGTRHNEQRATTTVEGEGVAKRLEETKPSSLPVTYQNIALHDAIDDYWGKTPFTNRTVTDESTETVATDSNIQNASTNTEWSDITSLGVNDPIGIQDFNSDGDDELGLLQSAHHIEGETFSLTGTNSDNSSSEGQFESLSTNIDDQNSVTIDYTIPSSDARIAVRKREPTDPDSDSTFEGYGFDLLVDGNNVVSFAADYVGQETYSWSHFDIGSSVSGSTTVTIDGKSSGGSGRTDFDLVVVYDDRYSYTFDNTVDSNNHLSGPELYPPSIQVELSTKKVSYNIEQSTVDGTWNDTSNNQEIATSNDGGTTYLTASNTSSTTKDFTGVGRAAKVRFTFSRHGSGGSSTPTSGFDNQWVDDYSNKVDGNDLTVVDTLTLTRNHFDNLQTLHSYGNFVWVIEHDSGAYDTLTVSSFQRGDETRTAPPTWDNPENKNAQVQAQLYFNSVYLEGAKDDQGNRPSTTIDDSTAISNAREKIQVFLRDLDVTTDDGATFRARSLLNTATSNNDLVGTITAPPDVIDPGYARSIDLGDGAQDKTVEKVSLQQSNGQLRATYDLSVREGFAEEISRLKRNTRSLEDQV